MFLNKNPKIPEKTLNKMNSQLLSINIIKDCNFRQQLLEANYDNLIRFQIHLTFRSHNVALTLKAGYYRRQIVGPH